MIILKDDTLKHVDSSLDILEHYGVKGMKWGKHRANMRAAKNTQKETNSKLSDDRTIYRHNYGFGYALGSEGALAKKRNNDFKKYADAKAQNRTAVKKQKYIDKYSINDTTKGLNAKGKKKYSKLKKKASKLSDKYYNDIESDYQNNKHRYNIQIT